MSMSPPLCSDDAEVLAMYTDSSTMSDCLKREIPFIDCHKAL